MCLSCVNHDYGTTVDWMVCDMPWIALRYHVRTLMVCLVFDSYSLAPENPYPAALNDAISVMRHVFEHSAEMAIDPNNVIVP